MSTLERTVSMLEPLTDEQLIFVQELAKRFTQKEKADNPYKPLSEDEFLASLAVARDDAENGRVMTAEESVNELRAQYGL